MSDHRHPFGDDRPDDGFAPSRFAEPRFTQSRSQSQSRFDEFDPYANDSQYYDSQYYDDQHYDDQHYDTQYDGTEYEQSDDYGERSLPEEIPAGTTRARTRRSGERHRRARRGKWFGFAAAAVVFVVLAGLVVVGGKAFFGSPTLPDDFAGPGGPDVVVQVHSGDTAEQIAQAMLDEGVVASTAAFYNAAVKEPAMNSMVPGFYAISSEISGADAVSQLVDPASRVGQMVISEGRQLHDSTDVKTGAVMKGIYTLISEASCVGSGESESCIGYEELNEAGASTDLDSLGVPGWAKDEVAAVPDHDRQLEGLIAAGSWNFDPTAEPTEILKHLVSESAVRYEETGIETAGDQVGLSPYEVLIAASLVEREAMPRDFAKVARVILNRLAVDQPLQFDSTVNYSLDTTELATTDEDRARVTPWNTYASPGLPATPIASPSIEAIEATESPAPGDWIYFVTIDAEGTTLFTKSYDEHLSNIDKAINAGILTSGR